MSKLTDEQVLGAIKSCPPVKHDYAGWVRDLRLLWGRAIEAAATEPLLQRIAELEANEKVLLAQVQGHTKWREKIVKASEQAYGESAIRYKFSLTKTGKCMNTFPKEIDGRWFALVPAEDDGHIGHIARIAELERRIEAGKNIVRNDMHRIGQLQAQVMELERQLEEARKDAERYRWLFLPHTEESLSAAEQTQTMPAPTKQDTVIAHLSAWYTPKSKADSIIDAAMQKGQS